MKSIRDIFRSYGILDSNGRHVNGSDKETNHRYGDAYEGIIENSFSYPPSVLPHSERPTPRDRIRLMMEVGIADGSSLLAWREVFPNALCVGMDIERSSRAEGCGAGFPPDRIEFHQGDATNYEDCRLTTKSRLFDVIIEDATHRLEDTLRTLLFLWPNVMAGGIYVIEEFANIGVLRSNVESLWPNCQIVDTQGPFGGIEPLVVLRKDP